MFANKSFDVITTGQLGIRLINCFDRRCSKPGSQPTSVGAGVVLKPVANDAATEVPANEIMSKLVVREFEFYRSEQVIAFTVVGRRNTLGDVLKDKKRSVPGNETLSGTVP